MTKVTTDGVEMEEPLILHCFADYGAESEVLAQYGRVIRVGIDPVDTNESEPIAVNAHLIDAETGERRTVEGAGGEPRDLHMPFPDDLTFDLGVFHPVCTKWAETTSIGGDPGEHPNMIPSARAIARKYCRHYVIENVPRAPLEDPIVLDGTSFGLPIAYQRAFETNFDVEQPPQYDRPWAENETSSFFFSERSRRWWASVKGVAPRNYPKKHIAKNTIPAPYIQHVCRAWLEVYEEGIDINYSDYDQKMEKQRRENSNFSIEDFRPDSEDSSDDS